MDKSLIYFDDLGIRNVLELVRSCVELITDGHQSNTFKSQGRQKTKWRPN